jgi:hypothetical protein
MNQVSNVDQILAKQKVPSDSYSLCLHYQLKIKWCIKQKAENTFELI